MRSLSLILYLVLTCRPGWAQPRLEISPLVGDLYVFTTYQRFGALLFPSNGLYVVAEEGVVMIDMPWDTTQLQPLLDSIRFRHKKEVLMSVSTHWHEDRTGGVKFFRSKGIRTYSSKKTKELCLENGVTPPEYSFVTDTTFKVGSHTINIFYPGHGHTVDNIVVWLEEEQVLYGGCLVKSYEASNLGYIKEADLESWPEAIRSLQLKYPNARHVIPGHEDWKKNRSLERTLKLLKKHSPE